MITSVSYRILHGRGGGEGIPGHPPLNETLDYISGYHMHCIIHVYWKNGL